MIAFLLQVDVLERDALEVLGLIRSLKNNFAPVNRIPPEVFSLIPKYWDKGDVDKNLIALTHTCHAWRELFIACSSLWARLDFMDIDKTCVYLERAKLSHLEVRLCKNDRESYLEDAFLLAIPHIERFKSLTVIGTSNLLQTLAKHFTLPVPLLTELAIGLTCDPPPVLDGALFNGNLSSLHTLRLTGVITCLPWKDLRNLTTFELHCNPESGITMTRLLNFLETASHLRNITLRHLISTSLDVPSGRMVSLPHLKNLTLHTDTAHSILLDHLFIPEGALLVLNLDFGGDESPLPSCLPKSVKNLKNLSHITTVNLCLDGARKFVRLGGPREGLYIFGHWGDAVETTPPSVLNRRIILSLGRFQPALRARRLAITKYTGNRSRDGIEKSSAYRLIHHMKDLRTLTLIQCINLAPILALNPIHNPSKLVPCPNLEELVLYVEKRDAFNIPELMSMAKERASKGAKLQLITIVGLGEVVPGKEVFKLKEHVAHVEYRIEEEPPNWDSVPGAESD